MQGLGKVSQLAEDVLLLAKSRQSLPCHFLEQPERQRWWIVVGWVFFFFLFAQPFHTSVFNHPEKASQRQRGKALGYSGCIKFLLCSTDVPAGAVSVPGSLLSLTDSSDAQMHKTFLEHLGQDPLLQKHFFPDVLTLLEHWDGESSSQRGKEAIVGGWSVLLLYDFATMCQKKKKKKE